MKKKLAVVMCVWKRVHLLQATLDMLDRQIDLDFDVYLWNNNPNITKDVDIIVSQTRKYNIQVHHNEMNIGGIGRFYMTNQIADQYDYVVFIDDDQCFNQHLISTLRSEANFTTISGWWAWELRTRYDDRIPLQPGQEGNYIGTGGMICPCYIFMEESLFYDIPKEFIFIEDLWLSQWALYIKNFSLKKSSVDMSFIPREDVRDQHHHLFDLKTKFYTYLQQKFAVDSN